ncbi:MAG: hypothetical protein EZS28_031333 [Streblomastix strix]|uniref:Uncharacterized protein n=1 Tax=Streblomastix strix TaxID=222440 RepID=A0A5J4UT60_9EUKA|nr:MAG: hypothetical protein EZS28_031333 [Streblomastix strix]
MPENALHTGTQSPKCRPVQNVDNPEGRVYLFQLCYHFELRLQTNFRIQQIPGATKLLANRLSRQQEGSDSQLKPTIFKQLCDQLRLEPQIDWLCFSLESLSSNIHLLEKEIGAEAAKALLSYWGHERI